MVGISLEPTLRFSVLTVRTKRHTDTIADVNGDVPSPADMSCGPTTPTTNDIPRQLDVTTTITHNRNHELLPVMDLARLCRRYNQSSNATHNECNTDEEDLVRQELLTALQEHGYVVLTLSRHSLPARIVQDMHDSLVHDFFPSSTPTTAGASGAATTGEDCCTPFIATGGVYVSETGVPMWNVGYELCDDGVREAFRVAAGSPDSVSYPSSHIRSQWIRGLALCRYICDRALQLTIPTKTGGATNGSSSSTDRNDGTTEIPWKKRPGSGTASWKKPDYSQMEPPVSIREGDYSVLYAMHYFNQPHTPPIYQDGDIRINVKQHVDPSLFVLEPFLSDEPGLQVYSQGTWITCDGPDSPIRKVLLDDQVGMVLFVGKGFSRHVPHIQPTLHRVVTAGERRRTMIYEQKYAEFFPPPSFD